MRRGRASARPIARFQQKEPPEKVNQLAYLALRHAQAGEARISETRARQEVARSQQDRERILLQAREREAQNAKTQAAVAQNQAAAAQGELADAQKELADLKAKQTDRGMVLTLGDVLFDTGRATLKPGADLNMDRLAKALQDNPSTRVIIEGHTDSVGGEDYNLALSERRAEAVASALRTRGVPADRFEVKGLGKALPGGNERLGRGTAAEPPCRDSVLGCVRAFRVRRSPELELAMRRGEPIASP